MDRPIITVPSGLLKKLNFNWDIDWRGQSMGETTGGTTQVVYNRFPRWVGNPTVHLRGKDIARWRAVRAYARGRVGIYKVPMCDPAAFRLSDTGDSFSSLGIPFDGGVYFSDGYGFAYEPTARAKVSAAAGAEQIRIEDAAAPPVLGQIMSHNLWPFVVTWIETVSAGVYNLGVQMPLREAIAAGDIIKLRGEGLFEATEDMMGRPDYGAGLATNISLSFQEVLKR